MILNRAGREYAHWDYTADFDPTGSTIQIQLGGAWYTATFTIVAPNPPTQPDWTGVITLLVAGPDATANPGGTVVLAAGANQTLVRCPDNPESVVRDGGTIDVVDR